MPFFGMHQVLQVYSHRLQQYKKKRRVIRLAYQGEKFVAVDLCRQQAEYINYGTLEMLKNGFYLRVAFDAFFSDTFLQRGFYLRVAFDAFFSDTFLQGAKKNTSHICISLYLSKCQKTDSGSAHNQLL